MPSVLLLVLVLFACHRNRSPDPILADLDTVFDPTLLHEIEIEVDAEYLDTLETSQDQRVPCTFTFDGIRLENVGIRQKGHGTQFGSLQQKPSFSIRFNEFEKGQTLLGLKKLLLNNGGLDPTLLHEALGFALYARAGFPQRHTAHARVRFLGLPSGEEHYGIHVMVEAVNDGFLKRVFGEEFKDGNLFEDENAGDFALEPEEMDLKDREEAGRSYSRLVEFSDFLNSASDEELWRDLHEFVDVESTLDSFALDLLAQHADGFWHNARNYYLYQHPADDRFIFIPHGMDLLFGPTGACGEIPATSSMPALLARRIVNHPLLRPQLDQSIGRMLELAWDSSEMQERTAAFGDLLESQKDNTLLFLQDLNAFRASRPELELNIESAEAIWLGPRVGVCGDGDRDRSESCSFVCDDGNRVDGDGCSAQCLVEFCGDAILQPELGEACDGEPYCNWDCSLSNP